MTNEEIVCKIQKDVNTTEYMELLYTKNRPLLYKWAKLFQKHDNMEDLMQEAYFGLYKAVKTYDPERDCLFMTHAKW